jgi:hypothetical protein
LFHRSNIRECFFRFWRDNRESIDFLQPFRFVAEKYPVLPERSEGPDDSGGREARRDGPRRASLSGQGGHIKGFICTLYVSCIMMTLIQFLQNEIDESKSTKEKRKELRNNATISEKRLWKFLNQKQ